MPLLSSYLTHEVSQKSHQKSSISDAFPKKNTTLTQLPDSKDSARIVTLALAFTSALHGGRGTPWRGILKWTLQSRRQELDLSLFLVTVPPYQNSDLQAKKPLKGD